VNGEHNNANLASRNTASLLLDLRDSSSKIFLSAKLLQNNKNNAIAYINPYKITKQ